MMTSDDCEQVNGPDPALHWCVVRTSPLSSSSCPTSQYTVEWVVCSQSKVTALCTLGDSSHRASGRYLGKGKYRLVQCIYYKHHDGAPESGGQFLVAACSDQSDATNVTKNTTRISVATIWRLQCTPLQQSTKRKPEIAVVNNSSTHND